MAMNTDGIAPANTPVALPVSTSTNVSLSLSIALVKMPTLVKVTVTLSGAAGLRLSSGLITRINIGSLRE